jgi:hypothetical protein
VVPRPIPATPRWYLMVAARRLPEVVVSHRHLSVELRLLPAAPFLVRRWYLIVVSRPLLAAPLAVRRTYLAVVLRPRFLDRFLRRRDASASGEEHSADEQKSRVNITSFMCTEARLHSRQCFFDKVASLGAASVARM